MGKRKAQDENGGRRIVNGTGKVGFSPPLYTKVAEGGSNQRLTLDR
jgi:hypothetical protein